MIQHFDLYYWPQIPGRGEYIRLVLEYAKAKRGCTYTDISNDNSSVDPILRLIDPEYTGDDIGSAPIPFAPPILYDKANDMWLSQTPAILLYLGPKLGLAGTNEMERTWINQLQLTNADFANEFHDVHHPIASGLYYEDQKEEALKRSADLKDNRIPKFLHYFERVLSKTGNGFLVGHEISYADLSLYQNMAGLAFAFPKLNVELRKSKKYASVYKLYDMVGSLPELQEYLRERLEFSNGLFRYYPELD